jgi:hypothetical protein
LLQNLQQCLTIRCQVKAQAAQGPLQIGQEQWGVDVGGAVPGGNIQISILNKSLIL